MANVLILFKAFFAGANLGSISPFSASSGRGGKSFLRTAGRGLARLGFALLMVVGFGGMLTTLGSAFLAVENIGRTLLGRQALGVAMASAMAFVFVFMLGFLSGADLLYKGKDLALLMSLPVTDAELVLSRMLVLAVYLLPYHVGIVLPALVARFIAGPFTPACITGTILLLLVAPLLASALSCLLTALVCRLGGRGPGRAATQIIVVVLMLALVSFMRFADPSSSPVSLEGVAGTLEKICRWLPVFVAFAGTLGGGTALADSLLTAAVCAGVFVLAGALLSRSHQSVAALLEGQVAGGHRRAKPSKKVSGAPASEAPARASAAASAGTSDGTSTGTSAGTPAGTLAGTSAGAPAGASARTSASTLAWTLAGAGGLRSRPPLLALAAREWDIILGSSVFAIEIIAQALVPLIVIVVWAAQGVLGTMESSLEQIKGLWFFPPAVCGVLLLFQGIGAVSATSVSREGPLAAVSRTYPLTWRDFVGAKLLVHLAVVWAPCLVYTALASWMFGLGAGSFLWMAAVELAFSAAMSFEGLAIDYGHPRLDWQNPQQAIKQNLNGLKSMGLAMFQILALGALLAAGTILAAPWAGWLLMASGLALMVGLAVLWVKSAAKRFYAPSGAA